MATLRLSARWVFPVSSPPLPGGVVSIDGDTIIAVEPHGSQKADIDFDGAAILPGLVNAHTHLDLTAMHGVAPPRLPLPDWLSDVIAYRRQTTPEETLAAIRAGLEECIRTGTTLIGDIAGGGMSWDVLATSGVRATVYYELIGMTQERERQAWEGFWRWEDREVSAPNCRAAISPHAPYSVARWSYVEARLAGPPQLATHLAESLEEMELLAAHRGPFVDFLQRMGAWAPERLIRSIEDALDVLERSHPCVIAHGNYLPLDAPIPPNVTVVYCPRTHAAFGHAPHPFRDFLARGVRVALGTDGLASNPDLNLLSEARFLHARRPDVTGATLLRMATLAGAEALGWGGVTGSLAAGKSADLVVVPVHGDATDPHQLVFASDAAVTKVMCRGRWLVG